MPIDELGLVPVAWRYRVFLHELTGEPTWSNWGVSDGPDNPGPAIGGRFEAEPLYDAAAIERLLAERDEARRELTETREVCPLVRRQDYFDVPTPVLVEAQIASAEWRALTDAAESVSERRRPVDSVLNAYRARQTLQDKP